MERSLRKGGYHSLRGHLLEFTDKKLCKVVNPEKVSVIWMNMHFLGRESRTIIRILTKSVTLPSNEGGGGGFKMTHSLRENKNL